MGTHGRFASQVNLPHRRCGLPSVTESHQIFLGVPRHPKTRYHLPMVTTLLTALVLGLFAGLAPGPYTTMVAGTALERGFRPALILALTPLVTDLAPMHTANISSASGLAWIASHSRKVLNPAWQQRALQTVGTTLVLVGALLLWQASVGNFQQLMDQQEAIRSVVEDGLPPG